MTEGYVYCFSNPEYPTLLKVGRTGKTPKERAKDLETTGVPAPFKIEFAKKVKNIETAEKNIHRALEVFEERPYPNREFFRTTLDKVRILFDMVEGEYLVENNVLPSNGNPTDTFGRCRDMRKCFRNGQRILHKCNKIDGTKDSWIGIYNSNKNAVIYNNVEYTLNQFVKEHYINVRPDRGPEANAWAECDCEVNGNWISTFELPFIVS